MINKIHKHLHKKTHVPTIGTFSVISGLIIVGALIAAEFVVPKNSANITEAQTTDIVTKTSCKPPSGYNPADGLTYTLAPQPSWDMVEENFSPTPITLSGIAQFKGSFGVLTLSPAIFEQYPTCLEIAIQPSGSTTEQLFYVPFSAVRSSLTSDNRYNINIPFPTTLLSNNTSVGYTFDLRLYSRTNTFSPTEHVVTWSSLLKSNTFFVNNGTSTNLQPYSITFPSYNAGTSTFTTSTPFTMKVFKPSGATVPVVIYQQASSSNPTSPSTYPWNKLPGTQISSSEYAFSIAFNAGYFVYRACPNTITQSQLNVDGLLPSNCSLPFSVNFVTSVDFPRTPVTYEPSNVSSSGFIASWGTITEAGSYRIDVAKNSSFTEFVSGYENFSTTASSVSVNNLTALTTYYYRVRAVNSSNIHSGNSVTRSVTTTATSSGTTACVESWSCTAWSTSNTNNTQTRVCTDTHSCGTILSRPVLSQTCTSTTNQTNTASTTSTTSGSPKTPVITSPASSAVLNEVAVISGSAEPNIRVKIELYRLDSASTTTRIINEEVIASATNGTWNFGVSPLRPAGYRIITKAYKNGVWSTNVLREFSVRPVALMLTSRSPSPLKDVVTFDLTANRSDISRVAFFRRTTNSAGPEVYLGSLTSPVQGGSPTNWSFAFNTAEQPNGTYNFFVRAEVAGQTYTSGSLNLAIANLSSPTTITTSGTTNANSTPSGANTNSPTNTSSTASPDLLGDFSEISENLTTSADDTQVVEPKTVKNIELQPAVDPRKTGNKKPETYIVQAVTNIETNNNVASGLKITGTGPPNTFVTVYIFSDPILITTLTDGNGNWTYTLDRPLENGSHEIYVTLTDDTGAVEEKSNPLSFFVAEARAVSSQDFQRFQSQQSRLNDSYTGIYIAMAVILVGLTIVLFLYFRLRKRHYQVIGNV